MGRSSGRLVLEDGDDGVAVDEGVHASLQLASGGPGCFPPLLFLLVVLGPAFGVASLAELLRYLFDEIRATQHDVACFHGTDVTHPERPADGGPGVAGIACVGDEFRSGAGHGIHAHLEGGESVERGVGVHVQTVTLVANPRQM